MTERIPLSGDDWLFKDYIGEDWLWRNAHRPDTHDVAGWQRGTVPGSVQHDLWQAGCIPDPYFERNSLLIERVLARTWLYKKSFTVGEEYRGCRVQLHFAGVDYAGRFYLNGELLGQHQGMFTPASFEVGDRLAYGAENLLCVVIDPAPAEEPQVGYSSRVRTHKARMNYWWDFCPRMIHLGIWDEVALEVTGPVRVEDVFVQAHLADDFSSAEVSISTELSALEPTRVDVETIVLYEGQPLACDRSHHALGAGRTYLNTCLPVIGPELWWPNKYGSQPLYQVEVSVTQAPDGALLPAADTSQNLFTPATEGEIVDNVTFEGGGAVSDQRRVTFGIRKVQMVANETPDSTAQPYTFVVNGRKLYAKGWNWVPLDALYGVERPEKLAHLLELACRANVNLLRVWGGGLIEREAFYDLCDRHGILVWQEFVQSSSGIENTPPNDPAFVAMMTAEARQILPLRRNHPSLVIWCGGNELMDAPDRPVDDERAPVLAALHAAVRELDPERHWLPASPAGRRATNTLENIAQDPLGLHDVHGPWEHQGLTGQYTLYNQGASLFHSEFGVEGLANLVTLERSLAAENRWPVARSNPVWSHTSAWWLREETLCSAFGDLPDLASTVAASQFLQAEGLGYAVEADRRRKYHNSGTLPWQFNEPYPNAACTSAVDYYGRPKPAYYRVARAYTPVLVSARFVSQTWAGCSRFEAEVWACNSHPRPLRGAHLTTRLVGASGAIYEHQRERVVLAANSAIRLAAVDWSLTAVHDDIFYLDLRLADARGTALSTNRYLFVRTADLRPMLVLPHTNLQATLDAGDRSRVLLRNTGNQAALNVWLEDGRALDRPGYVYFSDNHFSMLPGESRRVEADYRDVPAGDRVIGIRAWNATATHLRDDRQI